jgi:hypothetical protein
MVQNQSLFEVQTTARRGFRLLFGGVPRKGLLAKMRLEKAVDDRAWFEMAKTRVKAMCVASMVLVNCGCAWDGPVRPRVGKVHKTVTASHRQVLAGEGVCSAAMKPVQSGSAQYVGEHPGESGQSATSGASCIEGENKRRAEASQHPDVNRQRSLPVETIGVWAFSKSGCDLYRTGGHDAERGSNIGVIKITESGIHKLYGETASCAISAAEISTTQLSISFPARCHFNDRERGQFVIVNMHGNDHMRLSFLAATPFLDTADYVKCDPEPAH